MDKKKLVCVCDASSYFRQQSYFKAPPHKYATYGATEWLKRGHLFGSPVSFRPKYKISEGSVKLLKAQRSLSKLSRHNLKVCS